MPTPTIIPRQSLHLELAPLLRDMITNGELKPGEKIHEPNLCERFGVSRTPLREALKLLAAEGLVIITVNRGAVVAKITPEEINDLFPIMGMLEALAGELAAQKMTKKDLARLVTMHEAMLAHYRAGEWAPYITLNREIHEAIFAAAGNDSLTTMYNSVMVRIHAVRYTTRKSQRRWDEAVSDHVRLMAALEARDGKLAGQILREHLQHKADMVREAFEAAGSEESEDVPA